MRIRGGLQRMHTSEHGPDAANMGLQASRKLHERMVSLTLTRLLLHRSD